MQWRPFSIIAIITFVVTTSLSHAAIKTQYFAIGCNEYIWEWNDETGEQRLLYKCCGNCWINSTWTDQAGPISACGNSLIAPTDRSNFLTVNYNARGDQILSVAIGKGGVIDIGTGVCHPFTADNGNYIVIRAGI